MPCVAKILLGKHSKLYPWPAGNKVANYTNFLNLKGKPVCGIKLTKLCCGFCVAGALFLNFNSKIKL